MQEREKIIRGDDEARAPSDDVWLQLPGFDIYLVGFHPNERTSGVANGGSSSLSPMNEDFAQCVLFDGTTKHANMNGVEYII